MEELIFSLIRHKLFITKGEFTKMENLLPWLIVVKTIILLVLASYIYILTKKLQRRDRYLKGNKGVKHNVEFWMRFKGESEALKEIINKIELPDTNAVDANKQTDERQANITIEKTSGFVQVVTGSGKADQYLDRNTFSNKLEQYKSRMIANCILEEDIDTLLLNTQNTEVKNSFLTKYRVELAGIMINIAGNAINLLQYLGR